MPKATGGLQALALVCGTAYAVHSGRCGWPWLLISGLVASRLLFDKVCLSKGAVLFPADPTHRSLSTAFAPRQRQRRRLRPRGLRWNVPSRPTRAAAEHDAAHFHTGERARVTLTRKMVTPQPVLACGQ